jgi:hypothetical protein
VKQSQKFLFDECIGRPLVERLRTFLQVGDDEIVSILDRQKEGVLDEDWVPEIAADGCWVVVSADRGRLASKGAKLPRLCREDRGSLLGPSVGTVRGRDGCFAGEMPIPSRFPEDRLKPPNASVAPPAKGREPHADGQRRPGRRWTKAMPPRDRRARHVADCVPLTGTHAENGFLESGLT